MGNSGNMFYNSCEYNSINVTLITQVYDSLWIDKLKTFGEDLITIFIQNFYHIEVG